MSQNSSAAAVTTSVENTIGYVILTEPERRNPLSVATMRSFQQALLDLSTTPAVRVIVVRAEGPAFSAGHDLTEVVGRSLEEEREIFAVCTEMMMTIHRVRQPVIAAVQGMALAAGCQLVASCDLAIASSTARFSTPGVKIGLFCSTPMVALTRAIGRKQAMRMLLTGEMIDAATALQWGLVNEVVAPESLDTVSRSMAETIASSSAMTIGIGKEAFYQQIELSESDAYAAMQEVMANNATTRDAQEGISAFLGKRTPHWQDR
ncbi:enoyl-CoA hydratase [Rhodococcus sp. 1163]|uniref:enoyl-CoA hydratase n=1 Tax=Rhodococcus sp. 1163 TaxID=1905289 RepID=UPI000A05E94F|nr:enoyl-CoA hydratase [Rhodococcus sp. 1163]ORI15327.1 enoyl-CoA hydratase [Rhodococcus sp. 1163]